MKYWCITDGVEWNLSMSSTTIETLAIVTWQTFLPHPATKLIFFPHQILNCVVISKYGENDNSIELHLNHQGQLLKDRHIGH